MINFNLKNKNFSFQRNLELFLPSSRILNQPFEISNCTHMQSDVATELVNYKIEITALRMKCRISRKRHRVSQGGNAGTTAIYEGKLAE